MNLLSKLTEKTKKRIAATALAGGMALTGAFGLVGCNNTNTDPGSNPGPGIQTPGDNNSGNNNQTPDYSQYSQILQNVLTDQYYRSLIITDISASPEYGNKRSYKNAKFNAIPYGFLEEEGYDIDKIKNGTVDSSVNMYTIDNDLFLELRVETKSSTNYYTHYVLKYNLTNQELNELDSLFVPVSNNRYSTRATYYQAPFFIQELSYLKDATVMSEACITEDALNAIEEDCNEHKYNSSANTLTYISSDSSNPAITVHTFQTHMFIDHTYTSNDIKCSSKLNTILFWSAVPLGSIDNKNVFTSTSGLTNFTDAYEEHYKSTTKNITLYTCENSNFDELNLETFNNELNI